MESLQDKIDQLAEMLKQGVNLEEMSTFIEEVYKLGETHGCMRSEIYDYHGVLHNGTAPIEELRKTAEKWHKGAADVLFPLG